MRRSWQLLAVLAAGVCNLSAFAELPVIINGSAPAKNPPAADKDTSSTPTIVNYPSAALGTTKADPIPAQKAVAYRAPLVASVNSIDQPAFGYLPPMGIGAFTAPGFAMGGGFGGLPTLGTSVNTIGIVPFAAYIDLRPPLVNTLSTGVRANVGGLVTFPSTSRVFGDRIYIAR